MKVTETEFSGLFRIADEHFCDDRGWFMEEFNLLEFTKKTGIPFIPVQDNCSWSIAGVARGLHFQSGSNAQSKLVSVSQGTIVDFALDLRPFSNTFMRVFSARLEEGERVFIPKGFAHGFVALCGSKVRYKCDEYYCKEACRTIDMLDAIGEDEVRRCLPESADLLRSWQDVNGMKLDNVNLSEVV